MNFEEAKQSFIDQSQNGGKVLMIGSQKAGWAVMNINELFMPLTTIPGLFVFATPGTAAITKPLEGEPGDFRGVLLGLQAIEVAKGDMIYPLFPTFPINKALTETRLMLSTTIGGFAEITGISPELTLAVNNNEFVPSLEEYNQWKENALIRLAPQPIEWADMALPPGDISVPTESNSNEPKCLVCGALGVEHDTRAVAFTYKGHAILIEGIEGEFCPHCDEVVMGNESGDKYTSAIHAFKQKINQLRKEDNNGKVQQKKDHSELQKVGTPLASVD